METRSEVIRRGSRGAPAPEEHRGDAEQDLVQQAGVVELADQVTAADHPDVRPGRGRHHLVVHRRLARNEPEVDAGDRREVAVGEDPAGRSP